MSLEYYKKRMIDLRAKLDKEKEAKKKDNERYAGLIKNTTSASNKASYRRAASHDRSIESIKRQIENCKESIAKERKRK